MDLNFRFGKMIQVKINIILYDIYVDQICVILVIIWPPNYLLGLGQILSTSIIKYIKHLLLVSILQKQQDLFDFMKWHVNHVFGSDPNLNNCPSDHNICLSHLVYPQLIPNLDLCLHDHSFPNHLTNYYFSCIMSDLLSYTFQMTASWSLMFRQLLLEVRSS